METRELTDMTAVLRSINDGNPSNAERWVTLTQRVVRAETRANAAERAAARKDWEKQNAEYDSWQSNYRAEVAQQEAAKAQDKAARWEVLALTMAAALVLTLSIAAHQANEVARLQHAPQGTGKRRLLLRRIRTRRCSHDGAGMAAGTGRGRADRQGWLRGQHPAGPAPLHRQNGRRQLPALGLPGIPCAAAGACI